MLALKVYIHTQHDSAFFFFLEAFFNVFDFPSLVARDRNILPPDMLVGKVIEAVLCEGHSERVLVGT